MEFNPEYVLRIEEVRVSSIELQSGSMVGAVLAIVLGVGWSVWTGRSMRDEECEMGMCEMCGKFVKVEPDEVVMLGRSSNEDGPDTIEVLEIRECASCGHSNEERSER